MFNFSDACLIAYNYFKQQLGLDGIAVATENPDYWFFSGGNTAAAAQIGVEIISVSKADGHMAYVDFLSDEGYETVKASSPLTVPAEFFGGNLKEK